MAIKIAVGNESFDEIRKAGLYYVDKTALLYDLADRTNNKVTLFTRPRRFGKTLNMSMMGCGAIRKLSLVESFDRQERIWL